MGTDTVIALALAMVAALAVLALWRVSAANARVSERLMDRMETAQTQALDCALPYSEARLRAMAIVESSERWKAERERLRSASIEMSDGHKHPGRTRPVGDEPLVVDMGTTDNGRL